MIYKPLAELLRPETLHEYVGQEHLVGDGAILAQAIGSGNIPSMILWGPPGVGKTTLAFIIARSTGREFFVLSAINAGVKEVREVIARAAEAMVPPVLFIDEIHRFSKSQQDSLLSAVERGVVILIGATTENPSFEVITPLLSRCQVYILKSLDKSHLDKLLDLARRAMEEQLGATIAITETDALFRISGGDARKLYNAVEIISRTLAVGSREVVIDNATTTTVIQQNLAAYDKNGEQHYDIISAFIKSLRGSDPNGAVYWLARMIEGGEDPLFIARRMVILASEDIGNANPNALLLANSAFDAVHRIGWPEGRIVLSQVAVYLACSAKSNASYLAIGKAQELVRKTGDLPVPLPLRNAPTRLMKQADYGKGYHYAHDFHGNFVEMEFLPEALKGTKIYEPGSNPRENEMRASLKGRWGEKYMY